jgi:hypothetical protein
MICAQENDDLQDIYIVQGISESRFHGVNTLTRAFPELMETDLFKLLHNQRLSLGRARSRVRKPHGFTAMFG